MIDMTKQMMYRVGNLNTQNERVSYQMSTGKKLQNGSDDSVLYARTLNIEENIRVYDGLKVQVEKTMAQNNVSDTTLDEIKQTIDLVKIDLMKSLNSGMDESSRLALATNISGIRENLYSMVNTRVDGEYIFAGSDTTIQTFSKDSNFEDNGKVSFGGDAILRQIAVEPNTYRDRGVTAYDVLMYNYSKAGDNEQLSFTESERIIDSDGLEWKLNGAKDKIQQYDRHGILKNPLVEKTVTVDNTVTPSKYTTDLGQITGTEFLEAKHNFFDDLNVMINALKGYGTNVDGTKSTAITKEEMDDILRDSLENTSNQYDASNIGHAELGGRNNIFDIAMDRISAKSVHYNILMQEVSGADMSKLAMESKSLEMTYQALYATVSKMHSLSLLNFIK
jgi:flagellar hook-associated protein 3 FlgL